MSPTMDRRNHNIRIHLSNRGVSKIFIVARLVALEFLKNNNPEKFTDINHKDEIPWHNYPENLEWCDKLYNNNYGHRTERIMETKKRRGIWHRVSAYKNGLKTKTFDSVNDAAKYYNKSRSSIYNCLAKRKKSCAGHQWRYGDEETINE